jgi:Sec-independent protein translocase protein TatA
LAGVVGDRRGRRTVVWREKDPGVAKGLGEGIRNFKTALKGDTTKDVEKS